MLNWVLGDHLGSTSTTANADGSLNSVIQYTAYGREALPERSAGREIRLTQGMTPTKYRYTGQLAQAELGLDYYVARWYDPMTGHFTQADSIIPEPGKSQSFDRYAYVMNNPLRYNDPSGHKRCDDEINGKCVQYQEKKSIIPIVPETPSEKNTSAELVKPFQNPPIIVIPSTNKIDNNPKINPDNSIIIGYEYQIKLNKLDYGDIIISILGIVGDFALLSTFLGNAPGSAEFGGTEVLEFFDLLIKISDGYDLINQDFKSITLSTGETCIESLIKTSPISKRTASRVGSLIPIVGIAFDIGSIGLDFYTATDKIPIKAQKEEIITTQ